VARAVSAGLMAVTSRSWPDEILHLSREREQEKRDAGGGREKGSRKRSQRRRRRRRRAADSSALTLGFDARP
jgi:hypothetical protein